MARKRKLARVGYREGNRYYGEERTQGFYYFDPDAKDGEAVYIPEATFNDSDEDFVTEGGIYDMADIRTAARLRLEVTPGYGALSRQRKAEELDRLVNGFLDWCAAGEAWCHPETYFEDRDIDFD